MIQYRFLAKSEISRFQAALQTCGPDWASHWFDDACRPQLSAVACGLSDDLSQMCWYCSGSAADSLWIGASPEDFAALTATLLRAESISAAKDLKQADPATIWVSARMACAVTQDLLGRVVKLTDKSIKVTPATEIAEKLLEPHRGMLGLRMTLDGLTNGLYAFISPELTQGWLGRFGVGLSDRRLAPLESRLLAISPLEVRLQIELRDESLSIGDVRDLKLGDVIPLSNTIQQPLDITTGDGISVGSCYLGRIGDKRGVRLTKSSTSKKHV